MPVKRNNDWLFENLVVLNPMAIKQICSKANSQILKELNAFLLRSLDVLNSSSNKRPNFSELKEAMTIRLISDFYENRDLPIPSQLTTEKEDLENNGINQI